MNKREKIADKYNDALDKLKQAQDSVPEKPVKKEINKADYSISMDGLSGGAAANTADLQRKWNPQLQIWHSFSLNWLPNRPLQKAM